MTVESILRPAPEVVLIGFAEALRHAGGHVTADRTQAYLRAVAALDAGVTTDVYWAGRATLCAGPDDIRRYDEVFAAWFSGAVPTGSRSRQPQAPSVAQAALDGSETDGAKEGSDLLCAAASDADVLRHRDVADLSVAERAELAQLFATLRPRAALRRSARRRPTHTGEIDPRRTLRAQLRQVGEPGRVFHRRRSVRPRRVVLLVDVSGSMAPYADSLLRLAHAVTQAMPRQVDVFTVGTRLTHLTRAMRQRDCERALLTAGDTVPDWSGGTRLGETLKAFLDLWGQRGMARRAVVVVCSDGWERGDATLLGEQMQRLSRLTHRVVWMNPHRGKVGYQPVQAGIAAALPYVDDLVAGHSLAAFAELLEMVADA
ncbi:MAG: VWA domain-containing protein [Propionibacteriales bacterium]|nr:VWA domain-containing protein [Propionibacteriales bacterium]